MSLFDLIEPGAKDWSDKAHAAGTAATKALGLGPPSPPSLADVAACSSAISLKRIADALEKIEKHLAPAAIEGASPLLEPNLGDWINGKTDEPPEFMKP